MASSKRFQTLYVCPTNVEVGRINTIHDSMIPCNYIDTYRWLQYRNSLLALSHPISYERGGCHLIVQAATLIYSQEAL